SFLDVTPEGVVLETDLNSVQKTEDLIIAAYAGVSNTGWNFTWNSDYVWGSIRSDDAYKGGSGVADQGAINDMEQYHVVSPTVAVQRIKPRKGVYQVISRINLALLKLDGFTDDQYAITGLQQAKSVRQPELRSLRGRLMFILKRLFNYPAWIDHTVPQEETKN